MGLGRGRHPLEEEGLLGLDHVRHPGEVDGGVDVALHDGPAVVVLDQAVVPSLGHGDGLGEALLLEVSDGVVVGVGDAVLQPLPDHLPLEEVHQLGAVSLDLLAGRHGAEGDLGEAHLRVGPVADPADDLLVAAPVLGILRQYRQRFVPLVEDEPHDVVLGHLGQLAGEEGLEADELDHGIGSAVVRYDALLHVVVFVSRAGWWSRH
mmetsp:Transcript_14708/g.42360  ORF Transcript_14708/g.42360 Transcript_14708/m.42360 type:complete len:207 (-) Transcript_14708:154-774(-)